MKEHNKGQRNFHILSGGKNMEAVLSGQKIYKASKKAELCEQSCDWDELCEWGFSLAQKHGLTQEDSKRLLDKARKLRENSR